MTLVNCKISNYPLGEPDNQNPTNNIDLNSSVNLNTLPSHVKLVITPNNNTENPDGYYAVRAEDFHIGGLENYVNQTASTFIGFFNQNIASNQTSGPYLSMVYPIANSQYFGSNNFTFSGSYPVYSDPGTNGPSINYYTGQVSQGNDDGYQQLNMASFTSEYWGLGYSPYQTTRNQLSIDTFGDMGNGDNPGRIYHFHGMNSSDIDPNSEQLNLYTSAYPTNLFPNLVLTFVDPSSGISGLGKHIRQFIGDTFPYGINLGNVDSDNVNYYNQQNKGIDKTTSWTYINRVMIVNSTNNLPSNLDDPDAYPIDNEVHVWIEFKDNYILNATPTDNPELWDIKVDVDGAAKFIET